MADEQYDADGDVSRFLYEPTMEDPMATVLGSLTVAAEPQAVSHSHQAHQIQAPSSSSSHFQSPPVPAIHVQPLQGQAIHSQTHQASPAMHVQHHRVPAPAIQVQPRHVHQPPSPPMHRLQPHAVPTIEDQPRYVPAVQSLYQANLSPPSLHVQPNPASTATQIHPRQVPSIHSQSQVHLPPPTATTMHDQLQPAPAIAPPPSVHVQNQETMALSPAAYAHDHLMMMPGALVSEDLHIGVPVTSPSLYEQFMAEGEYDLAARLRSIEDDDDEDGTGEGGPDVDPVEDGVVFRAGQPRCENCHVVREVKHESESRALHFIVHSTSPATFEHAIITKYITTGGQIPRVEMHYVDLRKRTHEWVRNFISKSVETLRNDTSGQLHDSCSSYCEAVSTNIINTSIVNDPYMELEVGMLKEILSSTHHTTAKDAAPSAMQSAVQDDDDTLEEIGNYDDDNCSVLLPQILESSHVPMPGAGGQGSSVSATAYPSMLARQTLRVSKMSMQDTLEYLHKTKEDAEKEMSDYATFKQQCRKNQQYRWAAQQINKLNKKIMKLEQTGQRVGETGLLKIKQKLDVIVAEKRRLYADVRRGLQKERENKGDGPSGNNNDRSGRSGHNNKDGAAASGSN